MQTIVLDNAQEVELVDVWIKGVAMAQEHNLKGHISLQNATIIQSS